MIQQEHGTCEAAEDVNEESPRGADFAGGLDSGFRLNPVKQCFNGLANPRDSRGIQPVSGIEMHLSRRLAYGREDRERERGLAREVFVSLIGKQIAITQARGNLFEHRAIVQVRRRQSDLAGPG